MAAAGWVLQLSGRVSHHKAEAELGITKVSARIEAVAASAELAATRAHGRMDVVETRQTNMEGDLKEIKADVKTLLGRI